MLVLVAKHFEKQRKICLAIVRDVGCVGVGRDIGRDDLPGGVSRFAMREADLAGLILSARARAPTTWSLPLMSRCGRKMVRRGLQGRGIRGKQFVCRLQPPHVTQNLSRGVTDATSSFQSTRERF